MAAISAPTGGVKKVAMTCAVVLPLSSFGIFANALPVSAKEHTIRYTAKKAYTQSVIVYAARSPLGRLPRARMNCKARKAR